MKWLLRYYSCLVVPVILWSCDTTVIYELPKSPQRMVVNFVCESGKPFFGNVTLSKGVLEYQDFKLVPGVQLNMFEDGKFVETLRPTPFVEDNNTYESLLSTPKPGSTYRLEVLSPEYGTATASYTQPFPVDLKGLTIEILGQNPTIQEALDAHFKIEYNDLPGEDFYEVSIRSSADSSGYGGIIFTGLTSFVDPAIPYENGPTIWSDGVLYSDGVLTGETTSILLKGLVGAFPGQPTPKYHWVSLRHVSREYYKYMKTYYLQLNSLGDPYAQPVAVENNVQNGLGIFCGYSATLKMFEIAL